jgi:hypothetical protein
MRPTARILNVILATWLFFSAFLWPHTTAEMTNTWVVGVLCAMFALIAVGIPTVRYLNLALAVWLLISAFALHHAVRTTLLNNALVALGIFVLALAPGRGEATVTGRRPQRV